MSYSIELVPPSRDPCPSCGAIPGDARHEWSPTYNLAEIFDFALTGEAFPSPEVSEGQRVVLRTPTARPRGLCVLNGKTGAESLDQLRAACKRINDPELEDTFLTLEPSNGWGKLEGARDVLAGLLRLAEENPRNVWRIG